MAPRHLNLQSAGPIANTPTSHGTTRCATPTLPMESQGTESKREKDEERSKSYYVHGELGSKQCNLQLEQKIMATWKLRPT